MCAKFLKNVYRHHITTICRVHIEQHYQKLLERRYNAGHHRLQSGITDITTDKFHGEIKRWQNWKHGVGQLLCYDAECPRDELHLYFFGDYAKRDVVIKKLQKFDFKIFWFEGDNLVRKE